MRKASFLFVPLLLVLACRAQAQIVTGAAATSNVSANGIDNSVTLTIPTPAPHLDNAEGIVNIVLNSDTACGTIVAPSGWVSVLNTNTTGGNLCSRIYERVLTASESSGTSYTFSWTGTTTYTAKLLFLENMSGVDSSSGAGSYGTSWSAPQVGTNSGGEYLLAFFMNSSNASWTAPKQMTVVERNTTGGYSDLLTQAWQESKGPTLSFEASSDGGGQWGIAQLVAFRPSNG